MRRKKRYKFSERKKMGVHVWEHIGRLLVNIAGYHKEESGP
jgi:hypothetical protein